MNATQSRSKGVSTVYVTQPMQQSDEEECRYGGYMRRWIKLTAGVAFGDEECGSARKLNQLSAGLGASNLPQPMNSLQAEPFDSIGKPRSSLHFTKIDLFID